MADIKNYTLISVSHHPLAHGVLALVLKFEGEVVQGAGHAIALLYLPA